ncbi:hypothetical protein B9Z55_000232 [Caenorhabditis nigoni]|nr:hypothetical protein B9Z55_000232 [Caenorhabditis nigoni]
MTRLDSQLRLDSPRVNIFRSSVENQVKTIIPVCLTLFKITKCTLYVEQGTLTESKKFLEVLKGTYTIVTFQDRCFTRSRERANPENVLDAFRQVQEIWVKCSHRGALSKSTIRPLQFERLNLSKANWVNIKHLTSLFIDCKFVVLSDCVLTNREFRTFLERWMKGSDMRKLSIRCTGFNMRSIVRGLEATPVVGRIVIDNCVYIMTEGECYTIQQQNGLQAVVYNEYSIGQLVGFRLSTNFTIS